MRLLRRSRLWHCMTLRRTGLLLLLATAIFCSWFFQPLPGYRMERVHPRLRALEEPYLRVESGVYFDGGSVGIEIVDATGAREQFALPAHLGVPNPYSRLYVGARHDSAPEAVEVYEPEDTKRRLIAILRDHLADNPANNSSFLSLCKHPYYRTRSRIEFWLFNFERWCRGEPTIGR
jgi:hypothetical protein